MPADKVTLFRSLFRGRDDVYPRLWTNAKSGKRGYAPAAAAAPAVASMLVF